MGKIIKTFLFLLFFVSFTCSGETTENLISFTSQDTYFAGKEAELSLYIKTPETVKDGIVWNLKYSGRTIGSGEVSQVQNNIKIKIPFPPPSCLRI
jgi:hypothetical protein